MNYKDAATGIIRITRVRTDWGDRFRKYRVKIDGVVAARIRNGETCDLQVTPGRHSVSLSIDWSGSPTVDIDVQRGQTVCLSARPTFQPDPLIATKAVLQSFSDRESWIRLEREQIPEFAIDPSIADCGAPGHRPRFPKRLLLISAIPLIVLLGLFPGPVALTLLLISPAYYATRWFWRRVHSS